MTDTERLDWLEAELSANGVLRFERDKGQPALNRPAKLEAFSVTSQWVDIAQPTSLRSLIDRMIKRGS